MGGDPGRVRTFYPEAVILSLIADCWRERKNVPPVSSSGWCPGFIVSESLWQFWCHERFMTMSLVCSIEIDCQTVDYFATCLRSRIQSSRSFWCIFLCVVICSILKLRSCTVLESLQNLFRQCNTSLFRRLHVSVGRFYKYLVDGFFWVACRYCRF